MIFHGCVDMKCVVNAPCPQRMNPSGLLTFSVLPHSCLYITFKMYFTCFLEICWFQPKRLYCPLALLYFTRILFSDIWTSSCWDLTKRSPEPPWNEQVCFNVIRILNTLILLLLSTFPPPSALSVLLLQAADSVTDMSRRHLVVHKC